MPEQIWDAIKWVVIISAIGGWARYLMQWAYKYFFEDTVKER